jgi:phosphohistidine phosphatase SixA
MRTRPISRAVGGQLFAILGIALLFTFGPRAWNARAAGLTGDDFKVTTVYLVRHAEKAATPPADPPLIEAGQQRAQALARTLAKAGIKTILTSQYLRTQQTAAPLAQLLGLTANVMPVSMDKQKPRELAPQYLADVAARVHAQAGENVLIVGHSNTVPALIKALGGDVVPTIEESEYGDLFVVTVLAPGKAKVAHLRQ